MAIFNLDPSNRSIPTDLFKQISGNRTATTAADRFINTARIMVLGTPKSQRRQKVDGIWPELAHSGTIKLRGVVQQGFDNCLPVASCIVGVERVRIGDLRLNPSDNIMIQGLEFYGFHGATDEEQAIGHRYRVDVRLSVDTRFAAQTDRVADTVNYAEVASVLLDIGIGTQRRLLEALAQNMVDAIFTRFARVEAVELSLQKRLPPMNAIVEAVGVQIVRHRSDNCKTVD
jgi:dihydroneopterin aldolase